MAVCVSLAENSKASTISMFTRLTRNALILSGGRGYSLGLGPVWAQEHCRISPPRFLAECCKRQLNQGSFILLDFRLFTFSDLYWVCLSVFSCSVLFVCIGQVIGCEDRLRNDLYCVEWGVKLYSTNLGPAGFSWIHARSLLSTKDTHSCPSVAVFFLLRLMHVHLQQQ